MKTIAPLAPTSHTNARCRDKTPGAAVMDTAWPGIATAVMRPVLGPLTSNLDQLLPLSSTPSFGDGWFGYVSKDLRTELGMKVRGPYSRRYCGRGSLGACRKSLWAAIQDAANRLHFSAKKTMTLAQHLYEGVEVGEDLSLSVCRLQAGGFGPYNARQSWIVRHDAPPSLTNFYASD